MTRGGVLKYAIAIVIMQMSLHVYAAPPKDGVVRKGIIQTMYTKSEVEVFRDEVSLNGVDYKITGPRRQKVIESQQFLAFIQRYEAKAQPLNYFDFLIITRLTGIGAGEFVTGAKMLPLKNDNDLDDAIILKADPPGLEFVMTNQQCAFINIDEAVVTNKYYCGSDNYYNYM